MTLMEAAIKWKLSPNWVRELVKSGRVRAMMRRDVPVPFYVIPDDEPRPQSCMRGATRKNSPQRLAALGLVPKSRAVLAARTKTVKRSPGRAESFTP